MYKSSSCKQAFQDFFRYSSDYDLNLPKIYLENIIINSEIPIFLDFKI